MVFDLLNRVHSRGIMNIQTKEFSGPLDLLLQLIHQEEMSIFDIDICKITEQYLKFIEENAITDLDSAGDFIRMAALLIYIKSKSLFPSEAQMDSEIETEEDLQKALQQSLLQMQVVKIFCKKFQQRSLLHRDVWSSGVANQSEKILFSKEHQEQGIKPQPLIRLLKAHWRIFNKPPFRSKTTSFLEEEPLPFFTECIHTFLPRLKLGRAVKMRSLIGKSAVLSHTLVTFLALLELSRLGFISLEQEKDFSDIAVCMKKQFQEADFQFLMESPGS